jgi:hypothetical protein
VNIDVLEAIVCNVELSVNEIAGAELARVVGGFATASLSTLVRALCAQNVLPGADDGFTTEVALRTGELDNRTGLLYTIPETGRSACATPNAYSIGGYTKGTDQSKVLPVAVPMRTGSDRLEELMYIADDYRAYQSVYDGHHFAYRITLTVDASPPSHEILYVWPICIVSGAITAVIAWHTTNGR